MSNTVKVRRRTETVLIFHGDDLVHLEALAADANKAVAEAGPPSARLNPEPDLSDATEKGRLYDEAVAEAAERAMKVVVQALGKRSYRTLVAAHPPREDNAGDEAMGFDQSAMADALLEFWDADTGERSVVEPEFNSRNEMVEWLDDLNDGHFSDLSMAALRVNMTGSPDPKVSAVSLIDRKFAETSKRLAARD